MRMRLLIAFGSIILITILVMTAGALYISNEGFRTFLGKNTQAEQTHLVESLAAYHLAHDGWTDIDLYLSRNVRGQAGNSDTPPSGTRGMRWMAMQESGYLLLDENRTVIYSMLANEIGNTFSEKQASAGSEIRVEGVLVGYLLPRHLLSALPENFSDLLLDQLKQASLWAALFSGMIAVILAVILANLIMRPVKALTVAANHLAAGDLSQRVQIKGKTELSALGQTFNSMAQSLEEAEQRRKALTADVAHELRNPLAVQQAHLEALQDGIYPLTQESLMPILQQNLLLTRLVEDLRTLSLADAGQLQLQPRRVDVAALLTRVLTVHQAQLLAKNIRLRYDPPAQMVQTLLDAERIEQVLHNLLQNALRHTPQNGQIDVVLTQDAEKLLVSVHDSGAGIPPEALPYVFERFYRADKARDRFSGGSGLGLSIARKLAEMHHGSLSAANHPQGGAIFTLMLPLV